METILAAQPEGPSGKVTAAFVTLSTVHVTLIGMFYWHYIARLDRLSQGSNLNGMLQNMSIMGGLCFNLAMTLTHLINGVPCWLYLVMVLVAPPSVIIPQLLRRLHSFLALSGSNVPSCFTGCMRCLTNKRIIYGLLFGSMLIQVIVASVLIGQRFDEGGMTSLSEQCNLAEVLGLMIIIFLFYLVLGILVAGIWLIQYRCSPRRARGEKMTSGRPGSLFQDDVVLFLWLFLFLGAYLITSLRLDWTLALERALGSPEVLLFLFDLGPTVVMSIIMLLSYVRRSDLEFVNIIPRTQYFDPVPVTPPPGTQKHYDPISNEENEVVLDDDDRAL